VNGTWLETQHTLVGYEWFGFLCVLALPVLVPRHPKSQPKELNIATKRGVGDET